MKREDYYHVLRYIESHKSSTLRDKLEGLADLFPSTSYDALLSICLYHYQQQTKLTYWEKTDREKIKKYFQLHYTEKNNSGNIPPPKLLTVAEEWGVSPALLARHIIKEYLTHEESSENAGENTLHIKSELTALLRNPFLIDGKRLSGDVRQCVLHDLGYGPVTDAIRHMVGVECEEKLLYHVKKLNFPYQNEDELRKLGYDKTPDIKLEIPIYVKGQVVCWIESKASFGCPEAHKVYLNEQYYSYWNRFGPGLVIYWYGFVDELAEETLKHEIILMDRFPLEEEIVYFQPKAIKVAQTL